MPIDVETQHCTFSFAFDTRTKHLWIRFKNHEDGSWGTIKQRPYRIDLGALAYEGRGGRFYLCSKESKQQTLEEFMSIKHQIKDIRQRLKDDVQYYLFHPEAE